MKSSHSVQNIDPDLTSTPMRGIRAVHDNQQHAYKTGGPRLSGASQCVHRTSTQRKNSVSTQMASRGQGHKYHKPVTISIYSLQELHAHEDEQRLTFLRFAGCNTSCDRFTVHKMTALYLDRISALVSSSANASLRCEHRPS